MRRAKTLWAAGLFLAAMVAPAWANLPQNSGPGRPGAVNYVEGQASINGQTLDAKSVGSVELEQGQTLATGKGKTEILLTPGVFLRLGDNSSVKMISSGLTDTQVQLEQGRGFVEVDELYRENHITVVQGNATIELTKKGLYDFDVEHNKVRVFDGHAVITEDGHHVDVKGGHEANVNVAGEMKARGFDKKTSEDDLYHWSSLRSSYLAEANIQSARTYVVGDSFGYGWYGAGWYWNPWFSAYTFIPGDGFFYNPFGWGFYSPLYVYRAPWIGGFRGGYYGGRTFAHYAPPAAFVHPSAAGFARPGVAGRSFAAPAARPAFSGGARSMGGAGFHGGGGHR